MMLNPDTLKRLVRSALDARPEEIGCDDCLAQLDQFVELKLTDRDVDQAMSLVEHHLRVCGNCREEFEALLLVLQALN